MKTQYLTLILHNLEGGGGGGGGGGESQYRYFLTLSAYNASLFLD